MIEIPEPKTSLHITLMKFLCGPLQARGPYQNACFLSQKKVEAKGRILFTFKYLFHQLSQEEKEFAIQATSLSDTFGITIAGLVAIPLHNAICQLPTF